MPDTLWEGTLFPSLQLRFARPGDVIVAQGEDPSHLVWAYFGGPFWGAPCSGEGCDVGGNKKEESPMEWMDE